MKKVDVLILYEHKNRELESAARLCALLGKRGITSEIRQCGWNEASAEYVISPKVLIVPWCYDTKDLNKWLDYKGQLGKNSMHIINLHCEQVVFNDALDFYLPKGDAQKVHHISWGPNYTNLLIKNGVDRKTIHEVGSSRLDFFKKQYCASREEIAHKYNLDINKKWVLLVGNFSAMYFTEERVAQLAARGVSGVKDNKEVAAKSFRIIYDWYEKILENKDVHDNIEFIYRPHPSEGKSEELIKLENRYNNFHYIADGAIRDWYINCNLALVWTSTSSVEAYCAGVPVKSVRPIDIPNNIKIELVEKLDKIKDYNEFQKTVRDLIDNKKITTSQSFIKEIEKYYGKIDIDANKETVAVVEKLLKTSDGLVQCHEIRSLNSKIKLLNYCVKSILYKIGISKLIKKWSFVSRDRADSKEINAMIQKYRIIEEDKSYNIK